MATKEWREQNIEKLREYRRKWYLQNRDHAKEKIKERKRKIKTWLSNYKKELICQSCGENHIACLEFHHRESQNKDIILARVVNNGWSLKRIQIEIDKCQVLCANCHRKVHYKEHRGIV